MKSRYILIIGLAATIGTVSCSSSDDKLKTTQAVTANGNANTVAISNGTTVNAPQRDDVNAPATAASTDPIVSPGNAFGERFDQLKKSGEAGPEVDASAVALKNARPAPDNSTFTSYLTDAGYEIRTFKNHPHLLKVEKKITSDGNQTLKVFLRGGKVVELPGQKINPLATAPASFILQAAEVQTQPQSPPAGPTEVKKPRG